MICFAVGFVLGAGLAGLVLVGTFLACAWKMISEFATYLAARGLR